MTKYSLITTLLLLLVVVYADQSHGVSRRDEEHLSVL